MGEIGGILEVVFDILSALVESPEPYLCCGRKNHCDKKLDIYYNKQWPNDWAENEIENYDSKQL
jgi:hypothetical protein